jgi:membrane protease YdiL (CAAX protease family)
MATLALPEKTFPERAIPRGFVHKIFWAGRGFRAGWRLVFYLALCFLIAEALHRALRFSASNPASPVTSCLIGFVVLFAPALVMSRIEKCSIGSYGLPLNSAFGRQFWQGCMLGLLEISALVALMALFHAYSLGPYTFEWRRLLIPLMAFFRTYSLASVAVRWSMFVIPGVALSFLADALLLQFLMRGYTQRTLAEGIGFWPAAQVLSAIFVIGSVIGREPAPGLDLLGLPMLFIAGLFFSLTLHRTGSLWFAVGMQTGFELGATYLYSLPNLGAWYPRASHLFDASLHGSPWITGGTVGVEGSTFRLLTLGASVLVLNQLYPRPSRTQP